MSEAAERESQGSQEATKVRTESDEKARVGLERTMNAPFHKYRYHKKSNIHCTVS